MHDPSILLLDIPLIRLDVWHDEPGGHDAGEVCGYPPSTRRTIPRVVWAVRHVRHLHYRWWPYLKVWHDARPPERHRGGAMSPWVS